MTSGLADVVEAICGENSTAMRHGMLVPVLGPSLLEDAVSRGMVDGQDSVNWWTPETYLSKVTTLGVYDEWTFPSLDLTPSFGWPRFVLKPGFLAVSVPVADGVIVAADQDGPAKVYVQASGGSTLGLSIDSIDDLIGLRVEYDDGAGVHGVASELHFAVFGGSPIPGSNPDPYRYEDPPHGQLADSSVGAFGAVDWRWKQLPLVKDPRSLSAGTADPACCRGTNDCDIIRTERREDR